MQDKPLDKKYLQALSLLEAGNLTYREIAKQCSINIDSFYKLIEGKSKDAPVVQAKFTEIFSEIQKRRDKDIKDLIKKNKKNTQELIDRWLTDQKRSKKIGIMLMPTVVSVANALAKSTPNVEIGSFSYTKGLSAEDLVNEWKRLQGVGRGSANRNRIPGLTTGGEGESPVVEGARDTAPEEPEDTILRAEPETGPISPSDNAD